ncbi:HAMP domain-containing histidine kinase [Microbulbifer elongatus]|uniref:histidine kinase n=1 Tax=Microbulbifer elongatus TaxID=86173 RepID=A0ABT1NYI4_9GAMM|nr:HAMP domain-containing sensor histidine kinase [Microbulbifer elongatus]MCQ3828942.1 HAMP domain-containing histidine kinase [Microbulbifer elongatus]
MGGDKTIITNLRRLTALRAIALSAYIGVSLWLADSLSGGALAFVLLGVVTTLISGWRARGSVPVGRKEFFAHLLMDWLWLPPLLALSGGAANPFVTYLLVPLTIAAATQPRLFAWLMAAISIAIYTGLMVFFPGVDGGHGAHAGHDMRHGAESSDFYQHLIGMWATFTFSALLIAGFVNSMAEALRSRDRHLHKLRQEQARRDQVLSLGTLAAGTAHELASPLQTMGLLVEELQTQAGFSEPVAEDLALLQQQVNLCKQALEQLKSRARDPAGNEEFQSIAEFIDRSLERWQLLRPEARFELQQQGAEGLSARLPLTLEQTLINVLNNALDASLAVGSQQPVFIQVIWSETHLTIEIADSGKGMQASNTGSGGFGIGLILSKTALAQLGGNLTLTPRSGEPGTVATIELPLATEREEVV